MHAGSGPNSLLATGHRLSFGLQLILIGMLPSRFFVFNLLESICLMRLSSLFCRSSWSFWRAEDLDLDLAAQILESLEHWMSVAVENC